VVSVVALPLAQSPDLLCKVRHGCLEAYLWGLADGCSAPWHMPSRRQAAQPAYMRDGTVYAFWRRNVTTYDSIYGERDGERVRPLIIPASESCPLDTPDDWIEAERRLGELGRSSVAPVAILRR